MAAWGFMSQWTLLYEALLEHSSWFLILPGSWEYYLQLYLPMWKLDSLFYSFTVFPLSVTLWKWQHKPPKGKWLSPMSGWRGRKFIFLCEGVLDMNPCSVKAVWRQLLQKRLLFPLWFAFVFGGVGKCQEVAVKFRLWRDEGGSREVTIGMSAFQALGQWASVGTESVNVIEAWLWLFLMASRSHFSLFSLLPDFTTGSPQGFQNASVPSLCCSDFVLWRFSKALRGFKSRVFTCHSAVGRKLQAPAYFSGSVR